MTPSTINLEQTEESNICVRDSSQMCYSVDSIIRAPHNSQMGLSALSLPALDEKSGTFDLRKKSHSEPLYFFPKRYKHYQVGRVKAPYRESTSPAATRVSQVRL